MLRRLRVLLSLTNWMLIIFLLITIVSLLSVFFATSKPISVLDNRMHRIADISAYGAMVFAAVALIVSTVALKVAVQKPELKLEIYSGLKWVTDNPSLKLDVHRDTHVVLERQPHGLWRLLLNNLGNASARYPIVQVEIHDVKLVEFVPNWSTITIKDANKTVLQWQYQGNWDTVIHPNFPFEIPSLDFRNNRFEAQSGILPKRIKATVAIAADGFFRDGIEWFIELNDTSLNYKFEQWLIQTLSVTSSVSFRSPSGIVNFYEDIIREYNGPIPPTLDALTDISNVMPYWSEVFNGWKKKGIIS